MASLLDSVNSPQDIKDFSMEQLRQLCAEIRDYMVDCCSRNPGHLGASLGAVELIVGLHYVFDAPEDKLLFDVGHQAYAHKILTGRREAFRQIRTEDGPSGFPRRDESPYDAFIAGHASNSISAALGYAEAARLQGSKYKTVALIGDGALTGGLAFEGLNNAGTSGADLLIIVNDNNQSIDGNLGGLHEYLLRITTAKSYTALKDTVWKSMGETRMRLAIQRWWRSLKSWLVKKSGGDLFEALGLRYFGPVDGNDIEDVVKALRRLRDIKGPRVLHTITVKGKGYAPAEADPAVWHAPGRFDPLTGQREQKDYTRDRYQDVFAQTLLELARDDSRVVGVTPAMASGSGMSLLASEMPERFFDVGIEEEHAVTFSAGLAAAGMRPFCNIYSAFSQRAYDQIIHDVALQGLPVTICLDRAGLVGEDGATHQGAFDLAAYRSIPGAIIASPRDERELRDAMYTALACETGPFIIRYPRGCGEGVAWKDSPAAIHAPGTGECLHEADSRLAVITLGPLAYRAMEAAAEYEKKHGEPVAVYDLRYLKPLDEQMLKTALTRHSLILTAEDGTLKGGLYGAVCEFAAAHGAAGARIRGLGLPDSFVRHAPQARQRSLCGLDEAGLLRGLEELAV